MPAQSMRFAVHKHPIEAQTVQVSFDPNYLLASLAVSSVGFVLFRFGRSQARFPFTIMGVVMLIYPYFVSDIAWMLGLVPVLLLLLWVATRMGL